jgi:DMSO reductase anchor subunit
MRPTGPLLLMTGLQGLAGGVFVSLALVRTGLGADALSGRVWVALSLVGLVLVAGGGVASIFHMHRLAGARFVLRRLGTSWLSREVLTTGALGVLAAVLGLLPLVIRVGAAWYEAGIVVTALAALMALFVTAMIYATIPAMLSWHTPLTVVNMMGAGLVSGAVLVGAGWDLAGPHAVSATHGLEGVIRAALIVWGILKLLQFRVFQDARARVRGETGFGLPRGPHRLRDSGTTRPPYRTQPQVWPPLGNRRRLRWQAGMLAAMLAALVVVGVDQAWAGVAGAALAFIMVFTERWLFFADATHSSLVWFPAPADDASARRVRRG